MTYITIHSIERDKKKYVSDPKSVYLIKVSKPRVVYKSESDKTVLVKHLLVSIKVQKSSVW